MDQYKTYEDLPAMLNANQISEFLGISIAKTYILLRSKEFPTIAIGRRKVVPRDRFLKWINDSVENHMQK